MNPYIAPKSQSGKIIEPRQSATAIFVGAAIGNGTCYAVLFMFGTIFMWMLTAQGVPSHELYVRANQSSTFLILVHVVAVLCCLPGGYWSAKLGPEKPYVNSLLAAGVVAFLTFAAYFVPYELPIPFWSRVVSVVSPFAGFLLGARWWRRCAR